MPVPLLEKYFPELSVAQREQFEKTLELYRFWNDRINVISRKDTDALELHHLLHSLSIVKAFPFSGGRVLDFGTGGGFPGIPLAIYYPHISFHLVDSIQKKIKVVQEISKELGLSNVTTTVIRVEQLHATYDYITCRAVAPLSQIYAWTKHLHHRASTQVNHGWHLLKGGDLHQEISDLGRRMHRVPISSFFTEEYFKEKFVLHFV